MATSGVKRLQLFKAGKKNDTNAALVSYLVFEWKRTATDVKTNTSTITYDFYFELADSHSFKDAGSSRDVFITIGNNETYHKTILLPGTGSSRKVSIHSGTSVITHDVEGYANGISFDAEINIYSEMLVDEYVVGDGYFTNADIQKREDWIIAGISATYDINRLNRRSTIGSGNTSVTLGSTISIGVNVVSDGFGQLRHRLLLSLPNDSYMVVFDDRDETAQTFPVSYTVPKSIDRLSPSSDTVDGTWVLETYGRRYSGDSLVLVNTPHEKKVTLKIPSSSVPDAPTISLRDTTTCKNDFGAYVQGESNIVATVSAKTSYSAGIRQIDLFGNGVSLSKTFTPAASQSASFDLGLVQSDGSIVVEASSTDERYRISPAGKVTETVLSYTKPFVSFEVRRCDADGNSNDFGSDCQITYSYNITDFGKKSSKTNSKSLQVKYKKTTSSAFTTKTIPIANFSASDQTYVLSLGDVESAYNIQLVVSDYFDSYTAGATLSTGTTIIHIKPDGSVAFGGLSSRSKTMQAFMDIYAEAKNISIEGGADWHYLRVSRLFDSVLKRVLMGVTSINDVQGGLLAFYDGSSTGYQNAVHIRAADTYFTKPLNLSTDLAVEHGGTGASTLPNGGILRGNGTNAVSGITGRGALHATASGSPKFDTLPVSCGGTGDTGATAPTDDGEVYLVDYTSSVYTVSEQSVALWGRVVSLRASVTRAASTSATPSANGTRFVTLNTIRPKVDVFTTCIIFNTDTVGVAKIRINANGAVYIYKSTVPIESGAKIDFSATYVR